MHLKHLLIKKQNSENTAMDNFVYCQAESLPFCPAMWHEELFVAKVNKGTFQLFVNGVQYHLHQDDIIVLPPFTMYTLKNQQDVQLDCVLVNLRMLQNNKNILTYPQASNMDCIITPADELYPQILQALLQLSMDKDLAHMCLIDVQNLLHWLHHKKPVKNITMDKQLFVMKNALNIVHTQTKQLTIGALSEECGYSEFYLMKLFKKFVGLPCIDYSIGYKLTQIALALLVTDNSFCDLASDVGFANISYCNRQFKKMFACTPKEFRKLNKGC